MRLHTFNAVDLNTAMEMVREKLGDNAVIVSSNKEVGGMVRVTAAIEEQSFQLPSKQEDSEIQKQLDDEVTRILRFHKVPGKIIEEITPHIYSQQFLNAGAALEYAFFKNYKFSPVHHTQAKPLMLFGMPGIGKTLAISKMMTEAVFADRKINVITTDIKRAGGIEQLSAFTKILGIKLQIAKNPEQLLQELNKNTDGVTLIDSAGVNPLDTEEISGLQDLLKVADIDPALVMPAGMDVEEAVDMARAYRPIKCNRLIITKADSARRFGSIITVARILGLAFANFSGTPNVATSLEPITPKTLTEIILKPF